MEALQLAQQATLETRDPKHEPRTLAEQRATWHSQAAETLGGPDAIQNMISHAVSDRLDGRPDHFSQFIGAAAVELIRRGEDGQR